MFRNATGGRIAVPDDYAKAFRADDAGEDDPRPLDAMLAQLHLCRVRHAHETLLESCLPDRAAFLINMLAYASNNKGRIRPPGPMGERIRADATFPADRRMHEHAFDCVERGECADADRHDGLASSDCNLTCFAEKAERCDQARSRGQAHDDLMTNLME